MQRLTNYAILSLTAAILVLSSTRSIQTQEPPKTSRPERVDVVSDNASLEVRRAGVTEPLGTQQYVCRGKTVAVTLLDRPYGLKLSGRRTSYLTGGISERTRLVIRNRAEFNELWNKITSMISDKPPPPEVDFSREMVLVAAMGQQHSFAEIVIESACEADNQLEVVVRSTKSLPCGANIGISLQPVDIVRLPKTDLPVVFKESESTSDCKGVIRPVG